MELELKHINSYASYGLQIQYVGVLNGKEMSKWEKENQSDDFFEEPKTPHPQTEYGLKIGLVKKVEIYLNYWKIRAGNGHKNLYKSDFGNKAFLVLRPLSELTRKELELQGFDSYIDYLTYENKGSEWTLKAPFFMVQYLLSKHYDIFNLIENNLAIDINTLNP
jgi:hypothetical protein